MGEIRLSRAAIALGARLKERGAKRALTREIGCAQGLVYRWLSGERVPSAPRAAWLQRKFDIPVEWWGEFPHAAKRKKAA